MGYFHIPMQSIHGYRMRRKLQMFLWQDSKSKAQTNFCDDKLKKELKGTYIAQYMHV